MRSSTIARTFLDTNVLVYAFDGAEPARQARAREVLAADDEWVLSAQILGEFYTVTTRKLSVPLTAVIALEALVQFGRLMVVPIDRALVLEAAELSDASRIAYWDALVIRAAVAGGCDRLLTEDLNHGQVIAGVTVQNPFA